MSGRFETLAGLRDEAAGSATVGRRSAALSFPLAIARLNDAHVGGVRIEGSKRYAT